MFDKLFDMFPEDPIGAVIVTCVPLFIAAFWIGAAPWNAPGPRTAAHPPNGHWQGPTGQEGDNYHGDPYGTGPANSSFKDNFEEFPDNYNGDPDNWQHNNTDDRWDTDFDNDGVHDNYDRDMDNDGVQDSYGDHVNDRDMDINYRD